MGRLVLIPVLLLGFMVVGCSVFEPSPSSEGIQRGYEYLNSGQHRRAYRVFDSLADDGNASAQFALGYMYEKGLIYPGYGLFTQEPDYGQAASWYRKAAKQGLATAQSNLGRMYAGGIGVARDDAEAAGWYRKAAVQGLPVAQYNLAIRYYEGSGVPRDNVAAHMWASLAAANSSGRIRESAANLRDTAASKMTPAEISEAERFAQDWKPGLEMVVPTSSIVPASSREPPRIAAPARAEPTRAEPTIENRLTRLKDLYDQGLITDSDYAEKRAEILRSL